MEHEGPPDQPYDASAVDPRVLVNALRRVLGVDSVEIDEDPTGGPGVVRMVLVPGADEVAVATAVDDVLRRRYGLGVDPGRIEVIEESSPEWARRSEHIPVPTGPATVGGDLAGRPERPAIQRLVVGADGLHVHIEVWLSHRGRTFVGTARGPSEHLHRTIAAAALDAVRALLGPAAVVRLDVATVDVATAGSDRVALVRVVLAAPDGAERLMGASSVRDDVDQAVVRATLDAVNRRLQPLLDEAVHPAR